MAENIMDTSIPSDPTYWFEHMLALIQTHTIPVFFIKLYHFPTAFKRLILLIVR